MYLQLQNKAGKKVAVLRATRKSLFVRKTFNLSPPKVDVSFNLHTTAGISYKGKPKSSAICHCHSRMKSCCAETILWRRPCML